MASSQCCKFKLYICKNNDTGYSQMPWWVRPWKISGVFPMERMTTPGLSHLSHWHRQWVTPSRLWSLICCHPVKLLYRRWRTLVRGVCSLSWKLTALDFSMCVLESSAFWFTGVIQELQLKLREECCRVPAPQNFRPAPGTVCCAQFSGTKPVHTDDISIFKTLMYEIVWLMTVWLTVWLGLPTTPPTKKKIQTSQNCR